MLNHRKVEVSNTCVTYCLFFYRYKGDTDICIFLTIFFALKWHFRFDYLQLLSDMKLAAVWATRLSAGESDWTGDFSFFVVVIDLSDVGHG